MRRVFIFLITPRNLVWRTLTFCNILKNKEALKSSDESKRVTILTKQRPQIKEKVENYC